ncbi:hypothetical protein ElyMa_001212000 [Elysia marginata]|uniref:Uncharacterized protein n=1 Tax=Elysia marginata TaxID=1093978 RepID=A0AAV4I8S1_9GAST|nr:hypothetical protein ElyMa_001212000 [Elysia marginata]
MGPRIESSFRYEVSKTLEGARVTCQTFASRNERLNTKDMVKSSYRLKVLKMSSTEQGGDWSQTLVLIALICLFITMTTGVCLKVYLPRRLQKRLTVASLMSVVPKRSASVAFRSRRPSRSQSLHDQAKPRQTASEPAQAQSSPRDNNISRTLLSKFQW